MAEDSEKNRRRHERYETDLKVKFSVTFDLETRVDFRVQKIDQPELSRAQYSGVSRNVSVEGLCFMSQHELCKMDFLSLQLYVPSADTPLLMEGRVKWCRPAGQDEQGADIYDTGLNVTTVNGESVDRTIVLDPAHKILWSTVLENVFGGFNKLISQQKCQE